MNLQNLLHECIAHRASDLHLSSGVPPKLRVDGHLVAVSDVSLAHEELHHALMDIMTPAQQTQFSQSHECDFSFDVPALSRFRVNVFVQARGVSAVFRVIPHHMPTLDSLQVPEVIAELLHRTRGLVLVTGATGSGKSTTLAAMVDALNQTQAKHIITIEDPIEFVHTPHQCLIQQRELGAHTLSFANALRAALREDPDVILVGELRDLETIRLAITAAETGHLVLGSLHTRHAAASIERMVDVFDAHEKALVRTQLSDALVGIVSQMLLPAASAKSPSPKRCAVFETLVARPAVRHLIREGKSAQIQSVLQTGAALGMQTMAQALQEAVAQQRIAHV